ncbi:acidic leucine-rich nuclear phosphoprotein 32-related protein-like [Papaver somniferum]|uniref:acidic leucine-rich nuclear phosphoprotein 32-related protein-like n=1 Tax=Papaver somniferum TaxID=3469 RepID=UPI000E70334F|nr:acidic leucine-rich nuclear phosphoprotein 32-related protein-like [Papaver somniferum]
MRFLAEVFDLSDLAVTANLNRDALLVHFNSLSQEFLLDERKENDIEDDAEDYKQKYEHIKLEFRKLFAVVGSSRSRARRLRGVIRQLNNEKTVLIDEKKEVIEDEVRDLQDSQTESHELRMILENIRNRLRIEGNNDFDKALGEIEENRVAVTKHVSWIEKHHKTLDSVIMYKEGVPLAADLSGKLSFANYELHRVRTEAEQYKEAMEAMYTFLKRRKRAQLINVDRQAQRLCNKVVRDTANRVTTKNNLPTRKFPDVPVPEDEFVGPGSNDEEEVIEDEQSGVDEEDADEEGTDEEDVDLEAEFAEDARQDGVNKDDKAAGRQGSISSSQNDALDVSHSGAGGSSLSASPPHDWAAF